MEKKKAVAPNEVIGQSKRGIPITVLVIDDEFPHRRLMSQILKSIGFEVVGEAENGLQGLEMYKMKKPQLVVLDMHMPKMTGLQTLQQIMKINPNALVVMSTSETEKDAVTELIKAGAKEYIVKPVERSKVIEKMRYFVEEHDLRK